MPHPSPGDLPDPGVELRSPELQADSLLFELPGNKVPNKVINGKFIEALLSEFLADKIHCEFILLSLIPGIFGKHILKSNRSTVLIRIMHAQPFK